MSDLRILSPKRDSSSRQGWPGFFSYYAGFSETFARNLIASAGLPNGATIFDPWNGSGTTTYAAAKLGHHATGYDINPVMTIVARSRLLPLSEADSIAPMAREVLEAAKRSRAIARVNDPLRLWFEPATASFIRNVERSIRRHLVGEMTLRDELVDLTRLSGLAATLYVTLFSVCRSLLSNLKTSNPTWYRTGAALPKLLSLPVSTVCDNFTTLIIDMRQALLDKLMLPTNEDIGNVNLVNINTVTMPDVNSKFDFVLTSPPYCTRIDYFASTRIELAILFPWKVGDLRTLRALSCPLLSGPSATIARTKEGTRDACEEAQARGDHRQAA